LIPPPEPERKLPDYFFKFHYSAIWPPRRILFHLTSFVPFVSVVVKNLFAVDSILQKTGRLLPRPVFFGTMPCVFKKITKMILRLFLYLAFSGFLLLVLPRIITGLYAASRTFGVGEAPPRRVAIVFGAGLRRDGSPTSILRDRVATAADLYFKGKVEKLLMSGDNRFVNYNEPAAMREYAISLGVPETAIVLDYAGRRSYDTCYRASAIFGVKEALLVTQKFHLPRVVFLCNMLGVQGIGVEANRVYYRKISRLYWNLRELPATLRALLDVYITKPLPVLGKPEPIFPEDT